MKQLLLCLILMSVVTAQPMKPVVGTKLVHSHPLSEGFVGFWPGNEGAGKILRDISGSGNHGTLAGNAHFVVATLRTALELDGSADGVNIIDTGTLRFPTEDFSVFAWVRTSVSDVDYIMDARDGDDDGWRFVMVTSVIWISVNTVDVKMTTAMNDGEWHFVGGTIDRGGNGQMYLDGVADGPPVNVSGAGAVSTTTPVGIGWDFSDSRSWDGQISDVKAYSRTLTPNEVVELYEDSFQMLAKLPEMNVDAIAAPPSGGKSQGIIIASVIGFVKQPEVLTTLPGILVIGLVGTMLYSGRNAA